MSMRYTLKPESRVKVVSASGQIVVIAEDREDVDVDPAERHVEFRDDRVMEVRSKSGSTQVRVPRGTNVSVGAISGSVRLEGTFGSVKASSVSGNVSVDRALGDVDIRSVSGKLSVGSAEGECCLNSKSGNIEIGRVGKQARAATISGRVEVATDGTDDVEVKTISGHVLVRVPEGKHPRLRFRTLAGKMRCDVAQGDDFEVRAASVSGHIDVQQS